MGTDTPMMKDALSEARNNAAQATLEWSRASSVHAFC